MKFFLLQNLFKGGEGSGENTGHPFRGNQYSGKGVDIEAHKSAHQNFKETKGANKEHNKKIVELSGVKIDAPSEIQDKAIEAVAHVVDERQFAQLLNDHEIVFKPLDGYNLHGRQGRKVLYINSESVKKYGAGFAASIIRHELEHTILSAKKIPTGQQESKVRYTAGMWSALKYNMLANTNPEAAKGFLLAAKEQGIKL